jgi:hypothetical protein
MRAVKISIGFLFFAMAIALVSAQQGRNRAVLYEGARLITGDVGAPIENSAFLVENNRFTKVGKKGEVQAPAGATHVDLTGKTVIPGLIDIHNHLGWTDHKTNKATKESYTRELVTDHLQRYAYYGVVATLSMGLDRWDVNPDLPYQLRNEVIPNAARFLTVGRGIAATPMAGPWRTSPGSATARPSRKVHRPRPRAARQEGGDDQHLGRRSARGREAEGAGTRRSTTKRIKRYASSPTSSTVGRQTARESGVDGFGTACATRTMTASRSSLAHPAVWEIQFQPPAAA